jgi:hypothetical protein
MNRIILFITVCFILASCGKPSPEKYFTTSVLNTNLLFGFAGEGMQRQLESPSSRLINVSTGETAPEKRETLIIEKVALLEDNYRKVKKLPDWKESRKMQDAAVALYEYVLPVYKKEYRQLAGLYDNDASPAEISRMEKEIYDHHAANFEALYTALIDAGKDYAVKFNINVRWDVRTRP